jgi:GH24 family phage-related lysozyme (muramidase)
MTPAGLAQLKADEGLRLRAYDDRTGATVTHGPNGGNLTIGYGRNLGAKGITQAEAEAMLADDVAQVEARLAADYPALVIPSVAADVATNQTFNTGTPFPEATAALAAGDWETAAAQLLNSQAARELPGRYGRLAAAVRAQGWG